MLLNVQFSDVSETEIVSIFSCAQDPAIYPNQGVVGTDDARYAIFFNALSVLCRRGLPAPG